MRFILPHLVAAVAAASLAPVRLRCEHLVEPLGVEWSAEEPPRLSWQVRHADRGKEQTGYQLQVATSVAALLGAPNVWDSYKVGGNQSTLVPVRGGALASGTRYFWRVRSWTNDANATLAAAEAAAAGGGATAEAAEAVEEAAEAAEAVEEAAEAAEALAAAEQVSEWSAPSFFETGLPDGEWGATWIGGANQLRAEFGLGSAADARPRPPPPRQAAERRLGRAPAAAAAAAANITSARVYASGIGYYELWLNGQRASDDRLAPGWSTYSARCLYNTYDVTALLRANARNALGANLGNGPWGRWWTAGAAAPRLRLELHVTQTADGGATSFVTKLLSDGGGSWSARAGPITYDDVYNGEKYDARREQPGWSAPGFAEDGSWSAAAVQPPIAGGGTGEGWTPSGPSAMSAALFPPQRVRESIVPLNVSSPRPNAFVFDMGQNFAGHCRLVIPAGAGARGDVVRLRHAEVLAPDGNLNRANLQTARSEDFYTMRGDGTEEVYEPRFTYHGFRFVELFNFPGVPTVDTLRGQVVRAGAATGAMLFSEPILNKIARAVAWTEVSNLHSIPTSCENRDERTGWTGDNHLAMEGIMANFDSAAMYIKWLRDFTDLQDNAGTLPDVIPFAGTGPGHRPSDPVWSSAFVHLAWRLWRHFGDDRPMRRAFAGLKKYIAWLQADTAARGGLNATRSYYGDWIAVDQEPGSLTSAAYFFNDVALLSNISAALGQPADASTYAALASELKAQFSAAFLTEDMSMGLYQGQHWFGTDRATQGANAIALGMALTPDQGNRTWGSVYRGTLSHLGHSVQYSHNTHSTAGMYGMKHTFDVLWRTGNTQLAFEMLTSTTYPSFGGMVQNGATTLWELWSNAVGDSMNSHNHLMFSFIGPWMLQALVGLVLPTESAAPVGAPAAFCRPGWEDVTVKPMLVGGLGHAAASLQTMRGPLAVSWTLVTTQPPGGGACEERAGVRLRVSLPGNTRATVFVPIPQNGADVQVQELVEGAVVWRDGAFVPGAATGVIAASLAAPGEYAGGAIKIAVGSGSFEFELTSTV